MMFNISIDGGSFSKNLEDFDSIRSVLLYRSVANSHDARMAQLPFFSLFTHSVVLLFGRSGFAKYRRGFK